MQVIQTSVLLKYRPLFAFLQRQAANVAHEIQRSYVGAARVYYETGFRRYARSLGVIKVCRIFVEARLSNDALSGSICRETRGDNFE